MAIRPVFVSARKDNSIISVVNIDFQWHSGFAISQKQKSIDSLHSNATKKGLHSILEISSKSRNPLGIKLSAFNLKLKIIQNTISTVEAIYQGSKIFSNGGPYKDIYHKTSREAKKDKRLSSSGNLIGFKLNEIDWDLVPETAFYDWVYINALIQNEELSNELIKFSSFSDIEYNPKKQVSCQARSAAIYVSLEKRNLLNDYIKCKNDFIEIYKGNFDKSDQISLQF